MEELRARFEPIRERWTTLSPRARLIALSALGAFWKSYLLKLGLLEGWRGLVIAAVASTETFFRLMQRYATRSRSLPEVYSPKLKR